MMGEREGWPRSTLLAILFGLLLFLLGPPEAAGFARAQWERDGWVTEFEAGLKRARPSGKPAFVYFDSVWCSWCQQYKRDTLGQPGARRVLARFHSGGGGFRRPA